MADERETDANRTDEENGGSAGRTALKAVAVGGAVAAAVVAGQKAIGAIRERRSPGDGRDAGRNDEEDLATVLKRTALDVAVAAAAAASELGRGENARSEDEPGGGDE